MAKQSDMSLLFNDVLECCSGLTNLLNSGKRKSSFTCTDAGTPAKRTRIVSIMSVPPSSWEARRLKTDMIAMKAQITKLEARINHQHAIRKKMQILFDKEKASLVDQHKRDERLMSNLENRLKLVRKREQDLRDELTQSVKEFKDSKAKWESERLELQRQVAELKDQLLEADVSNKDQLSEMEKDMNELLAALEGAQEESEFLKGEVEKLKEKYDQCTSFKALIQKKAFEMQQATYKLKEIEYERDSYKYWQQQAKTPEERLSNMADLETEVVRIGATDGSLRDAVCKKLILEEQVHILSTKLEALQPVQQELHEAKVKIASLESSLEEWRSTARGHGVETARALSSALENALSGQLNAVAGASQAQSQLARLTEEVAATLKFEGDKATAKLNDLETVRKNQESLIHRLKKRLLLVTRERDSYRQQLDSYEKELTVTLSGDVGAGGAALLSARVEQLEKALQGYRDLLSTHDQEGHSKALEAARAEVSKYREEAEAAKREVSKLRAQRDQLHAHSEKLAAPTKTKKLKAALREGGSCSEDMQQLKQQLENSRIKLQRMKEKLTASAQEYRDFCYMLLGYKIDRIGHKKYRVSNKYSKTPDEYLTVTLCEDGIEMVHTDYSSTLEELVELHLHQHHSIPMFLSALTMDLFTRTTMQGA